MDDADIASELSEQDVAERLRKHRAELKRPGSETCIDCEETIPIRRRLKMPSCTRCVACQELHEEEEKRMRRLEGTE